jgi:hypothetical protein
MGLLGCTNFDITRVKATTPAHLKRSNGNILNVPGLVLSLHGKT